MEPNLDNDTQALEMGFLKIRGLQYLVRYRDYAAQVANEGRLPESIRLRTGTSFRAQISGQPSTMIFTRRADIG